MAETLRSHWVTAAVWILSGGIWQYAIGVALAHELANAPGGPQAFAAGIMPATESMRLLRWPAERLDTLGGYLTYHNITLFFFALAIYGAVQGARAVRRGEDQHSLEEILATGWSRRAVIRDRILGALVVYAAIAVGLGLWTAAAMAAGGQPNFSGSMISLAEAGLCAIVGYSLGLLLSQLTRNSRAAAGLSSFVLAALYVGYNGADQFGAFGAIRYISPFYYANLSRPLVPGRGFDLGGTVVLVCVAAVLLVPSVMAFERRDYGAPLWVRRRARARAEEMPGAAVWRMLGSVWSASILRGRYGLIAWIGSAALLSGVMMSLLPTVRAAWETYASYLPMGGAMSGATMDGQFIAYSAELVSPVIAAYVVAQAGSWVADLAEGRVETVLAAPVSWTRLVFERLLAMTVGVALVVVGAIVGLAIGASGVDASLDAAGLGRLAASCVLLGVALGAVASLAVVTIRRGVAVTVLAVFVGASYLLQYLATIWGWPDWVNRLSIFSALGHPYLDWPSAGGLVVLLAIAVVGAPLAALLAERTPKVE